MSYNQLTENERYQMYILRKTDHTPEIIIARYQKGWRQTFFAHPYASWERAINENTNGLIRQYFFRKEQISEK